MAEQAKGRLRRLADWVAGGIVWDALKAAVRVTWLWAISTLPLATATIKRLMPTVNWLDAGVSALLVTLSIFIPLTLLIAALRTQPSPQPSVPISTPTVPQENLAALGKLIEEGERIQNNAPDSDAKPDEVEQWEQTAQEWARRTKEFLKTQARPQALARFTSTSALRDHSYPGVASGAHWTMNYLRHFLQNLTEILEKPEVYF